MIMNISSWRKALISPEHQIQKAIENLDMSALQIALVVSNSEQLLGTITDGDIRRALIRGVSLDCPISEIMNISPLVAPPRMAKSSVLKLMQINKVHQLPVVDEQRRVCGLHLLEDFVSQPEIPNQLVIMAGGKGTRLRPLTQSCPKPMLKIGNKPMLDHIITRAKEQGIRNVTIAVNYLGEMIESYFGDGSAFDLNISYLKEENALGTAGALSLLETHCEHPIVVTNGDVLTNIHYADLLDFHEQNNAMATMAVKQHEWQNPFGVVKTKGVEIDSFDEKPITRCHVNAGIYVLSIEALSKLEPNCSCDMPGLFEAIKADNGKTIAYPMYEPWLDVGRPDDLALAQVEPNH